MRELVGAVSKKRLDGLLTLRQHNPSQTLGHFTQRNQSLSPTSSIKMKDLLMAKHDQAMADKVNGLKTHAQTFSGLDNRAGEGNLNIEDSQTLKDQLDTADMPQVERNVMNISDQELRTMPESEFKEASRAFIVQKNASMQNINQENEDFLQEKLGEVGSV